MKVFIEKAENLSPSVKLYTLKALEEDFSFLPGQFFSFLVPDKGRNAVRAYSLASRPELLPKIELCVRQIPGGVGTEYLSQSVGREIEVSSVQGDFVVPDSAEKILFLASGVGISPVRSQIHSFIDQPDKTLKLLYRHRADELLFEKEWRGFERRKNFTLVPIRFDKYNQIYERVLRQEISSPPDSILVVGPPNFVKQNRESAEKWGYDKEKIIMDIWEA